MNKFFENVYDLKHVYSSCAMLTMVSITIKAASSDGRDLAPGSLPTGGFRKTGNGEQYAFKIANIEGYVKVI